MPLGSDDAEVFAGLLEPHRREIQLHCYRMLGSLQDAEDLVQETLFRAWRARETFRGLALRAWLYKIATNACLDLLERRPRRLLPTHRSAPADPGAGAGDPLREPIWPEPYPDDLLPDESADPAAAHGTREAVRLAFLALLQALTPRQRAALVLHDVLAFRAREVADLLNLSVPAVNSLLHRARATFGKRHLKDPDRREPTAGATTDPDVQDLLGRYVRAWESADVDGLVALLTEEARLAMPPVPAWYLGRDAIRDFVAAAFAAGPANRWRLLPVRANGQPGFGVYLRSGAAYEGVGIQVLTLVPGQVEEIMTFMNPALMRKFGLPVTVPDSPSGSRPTT